MCICILCRTRMFKGLAVDQSPASKVWSNSLLNKTKENEAFWYSNPRLFCHRQCILYVRCEFVASLFTHVHEVPAHTRYSTLMHMVELQLLLTPPSSHSQLLSKSFWKPVHKTHTLETRLSRKLRKRGLKGDGGVWGNQPKPHYSLLCLYLPVVADEAL